MVKSAHQRLLAKGKDAEAVSLCVNAAQRLCQDGEFELAADLGKTLISHYEEQETCVSQSNLQSLESILEPMPPGSPKYSLLQSALTWSASAASSSPETTKQPRLSNGHPRLHELAAKTYWQGKEYGKSQAHYVYCGDGPGLAQMVLDWRKRGYPNEQGLFALRTLLILLYLNDLTTARSFWTAINSTCGDRESGDSLAQPPPSLYGISLAGSSSGEEVEHPDVVVQCGTFFLAAAEARNLEFFRTVRVKYFVTFRRDASLCKLLDEIEILVFGVTAQRGGLNAIFDALLSASGGGGER
jgi:hypothetical protein